MTVGELIKFPMERITKPICSLTAAREFQEQTNLEPPSELLARASDQCHLQIIDRLLDMLGSKVRFSDIIFEHKEIDESTAVLLEYLTNVPKDAWLTRQKHFSEWKKNNDRR